MDADERLALCLAFFEMDGETVVWKRQPSNSLFGADGWREQFMAKRAGRPVQFYPTAFGHLLVKVRHQSANVTFSAHRIVWALTRGEYPACDLDHVNNDPADNRPGNLRLASRGQNATNSRRGKAGLKGAYQDRAGNWFSAVWDGRKLQYLGQYPDQQAAHHAWVKAKAAIAGEFFNPGYASVFD